MGDRRRNSRTATTRGRRNIRHFHMALEIMQKHQTTENKVSRTSEENKEDFDLETDDENKAKTVLQHALNTEKMKQLTVNDKLNSNKAPCRIDFEELEKLLEKQPTEILFSLNIPNSGFVELLNEISIETGTMNLLLTVLSKVCRSTEQQNLAILFNKVISDSKFFQQHLLPFITSLKELKVSDYDAIDCMTRIIIILSKFQQILPFSAADILSLVLPSLSDATKDLERQFFLPHLFQMHLQILRDSKEAVMKAYDLGTREKISASERLHAKEPPEDYRTIPIFPTKKDFMDGDPFLRPNIVHGSYIDVSHYLDVQFRLLREDYVRPFRKCIQSCINYQDPQICKKQWKKTSVYTDVHVLCPYNMEGRLVHLISFDVKPFQHVHWEVSKRLLPGSLLCLSSNNFDFMLFATVANRNPVELARGKLEVYFEQLGEQIFSISPSTSFVMVESEAYFEAFRHTLAALQQMGQCTLPLKEYIVNVEKDIRVPKYLRHDTMYDFSSTFNFKNGFVNNIPVLKTDNWPSSKELGLDHSQYCALQAALTKAFAIIQGPPGTGKTYIGLKIAQILMENYSIWKQSEYCPVLVVCYTNHALDQFLEGILRFTKEIVRIGGRCNNSTIKEYQLSELCRTARAARQIPQHIYLQRRRVLARIELIENSINCYTHLVENSTKQVLPLMFLEAFMESNHIHSLYGHSGKITSSYGIAEWLGIPDCQLSNDDFVADEEAEPLSADYWGTLDCKQDYTDFELSLREIDEDEYICQNSNKVVNKTSYEECCSNEWKQQEGYYKMQQYINKQMNSQDMMTVHEAKQTFNVWKLLPADRWRLYRLWVAQYVANLISIIAELHKCYHYESESLRELRAAESKYLLRNAKVVGMTTTGAGKYRSLLQELQPRIVIVEEAAEVLEAHVVTALARNTEHLILIGDHEQLRPSPTVYELATKYSLDISLFERMIKNGMACHQLTQQHRMRPCISSLLTHIYSHLRNHSSVYNYENILGVGTNMFFINHSHKENSVADSKSYSNTYEAKFLLALSRYLRHQGYDASQVTILTLYSEQLLLFERLMKGDSLLEGIHVTLVDNFQGEENDIILVSFVRSNDRGSIGFLKVSNRVCVALSRAKKGLYCIGNFDLLAKESTLWKNIVVTVQAQDVIGNSLELNCQNHPETVINVQAAEDFSRYVPDGGCNKPCTFVLDCGHVCSRSCHSYDSGHSAFKCKKGCLKVCKEGHKCQKPCFKECGNCKVLVEKVIPRCGHKQLIPCHLDSSKFSCPVICNKMLSCGHFCSKSCHENCACIKVIKRMFNCGHVIDILCSRNSPNMICPCPCNRILLCGHHCKEPCGALPCPPCQQPLKTQLSCGHEREVKCSEYISMNITCKLPCDKLLDCKHKCHLRCGHSGICGPCQQPCRRRLLCGDKCSLKCFETCPELCRTCRPLYYQQFDYEQNCIKKWSSPLGFFYDNLSDLKL